VCGGGDEAMAPRLIHTAIWAFHGADDQAVSVERSRKMIAAIKKAGGSSMYTEYKGVGHNSWERAFVEPDLLSWVFSQRARHQKDPDRDGAASPFTYALAREGVGLVSNTPAKDIMNRRPLEAFLLWPS